MKVGVCAIVKNENLYLRDWVDYHLRLGFDKIFIYDNNNVEKPELVIYDYLINGKVSITKWENQTNPNGDSTMNRHIYNQISSYNDCIKNNQDFDWIAFIDVDEYIRISGSLSIKDIISGNIYQERDAVLLSWRMMGEPSALYYENIPVQERFSKQLNGVYAGVQGYEIIKSFVNIRSGVTFSEQLYNNHSPNTKNACTATGYHLPWWDGECQRVNPPCYEVMWIDHYYTKSLTEYLIKSITSTHRYYNDNWIDFDDCINQYKNLNGWSDEHEKVYQDFLRRFC